MSIPDVRDLFEPYPIAGDSMTPIEVRDVLFTLADAASLVGIPMKVLQSVLGDQCIACGSRIMVPESAVRAVYQRLHGHL